MRSINLLSLTISMIVILTTATVHASTVSEIAMMCKNPNIIKLDKDYTNIVATCKDNGQWTNRSMTIEREKTYIVNKMMGMPYFIISGFLGTASAGGVAFYNIKEIDPADILKRGEMICRFQAATNEEPPITECFDSSNQKWIDVRSKNIQGNFTTLLDYGSAKVIIKNNKIVNFIEIQDNTR